MILAAGRGTRLGSLGATVPKVLVEVGGEPLLARQIRHLQSNGIAKIVINAHHLASQIAHFVAAHPAAADIELVLESELLGTAGGVRNALELLGAKPFVVLYGDVLIDAPIAAMLAHHRDAGAMATLALYRTAEVDGKGIVECDSSGRVRAFREKTLSHADRESYVNAGLYVLESELLADWPEGQAFDFGRDVFPAALAKGAKLSGYLLGSPVIDVGTPAGLAAARINRARIQR